MFCVACGKPLAEGVKWCPNCGYPIGKNNKEQKEFVYSGKCHEFEHMEGCLYRCKKCGLEALEIFGQRLNLKYYGSYIENKSFVWHTDDMTVEEIEEINLSFGDFPIQCFSVLNRTMKHQNAINGSRDGGRAYSADFFVETTVKLSKSQYNELRKLLFDIDFSKWKTNPRAFVNIGAPGYCVSEIFSCTFRNGKTFICWHAGREDGFKKIALLLQSFYDQRKTSFFGFLHGGK